MSETSTTDNWVGFSAITVLGYSLTLIAIHMFIPHPSASKKVITLSYTSLTLLAMAQACIVGTYFVPHIDGFCICSFLWWIAATCYILSIYCIKLVYIERVSILNRHPMLTSKGVDKWIRYLFYSLIFTCLFSLGMLFALSDGQCHEDLTRYGCIPRITDSNIYLAIIMITFDSILFAGFCYKWWKLINVFKLSSNNAILREMVHSFSIQFIVTIVAMMSCVTDGIINLWSQDYSIKIIFCVDCAVIASCNFAMIKESQAFMWKYLCWPCKIPSFLLRGTSESKLKPEGRTSNLKSRAIKRDSQGTKTPTTDDNKRPKLPNEVPRSKAIESSSKLDGLPIEAQQSPELSSNNKSRTTQSQANESGDKDNDVLMITPNNIDTKNEQYTYPKVVASDTPQTTTMTNAGISDFHANCITPEPPKDITIHLGAHAKDSNNDGLDDLDLNRTMNLDRLESEKP